MSKAKSSDLFRVVHKKDGATNIVTFEPATPCGYEPVSIELTNEQWDALRYGFATMVNDKEKITKLAYVY